MTAPVVGQVAVEISADARRLAGDLRREVDNAFKGLDVGKHIQDSVNRATLTVRPDVDTSGIDAKLRAISAAGRGQKFTVGAQLDGSGLAREARRAVAAAQAAAPDVRVGVDVDTSQAAAGARALGSAASTAVGGVSQLAGTAGSAAGPLGAAAAAVLALGAAMAAAAPTAGVLAGALAAVPAAAAGIGGAFGALKLGFSGISDAFKPKAGGGGGGGEDPAARARRIAAAERGVDAARRGIAAATRNVESAERGYEAAQRATAEAERRSKEATEALSAARRRAKEDIEDLARSLNGARLSEERAARDVEQARKELSDAQFSQNPERIAEADLAYREALQTLEEAKDRTADLGEEQAASAKAGVEGSQTVRDALQDQADARQGVIDAHNAELDAANAVLSANDGLKSSYDSLKSAQDALAQARSTTGGGGGGGGLADPKLAPNAERFVAAVKALKPAFEGLQLDVQNRLFAGLDTTVTNLATAWLPTLREELGGFADTFNGLFRTLGASLGEPQFIADIAAAMTTFRENLEKVGRVVTGPLVGAFGTLAEAAGPFIDAVGDELATALEDFSAWIAELDANGDLEAFFTDAAGYFRDFVDIGKDVASIVGDVIDIFMGSDDLDGDDSGFAALKDGLQSLKEALDDPTTKKNLTDFVAGFNAMGGTLLRVAMWAQQFSLANVFSVDTDGVAADLAALGDSVTGFFSGLGDKIGDVSGDLIGKGQDLVDGVREGITGKLEDVKAKAAEIRTKVVEGVGAVASTLAQKGRDLVGGLRAGIAGQFPALQSRAAQLRGKVVAGVGSVIALLVQKGKDAVTGIRSGIASQFLALRNRANELRAKITGGVGNLSTLLKEAGKAVIDGLIAGIASKVDALGDYLGSIGTFIQDHKGPIEKDRVLLYGAGQAIMAGLQAGIADGKASLAGELESVTDLIGVGASAGLSHELTASLAALPAAPAPQGLQVGFTPGATGDPLLDALREVIQVRYGGNTQVALGA